MSGQFGQSRDDLNQALVREMLLAVAAMPETEKRLGVPVPQLERRLRERTDSLTDQLRPNVAAGCREHGCSPVSDRNCKPLSREEINFLLDGFDEVRELEDV